MSSIAKPGEEHDKRGIPIYPGDLCRAINFRQGPQGKGRIHYHHHVATVRNGSLFMVPPQHLEPSTNDGTGAHFLMIGDGKDLEIIDGYGPGDCLDFRDRKLKRYRHQEVVR